MNGSKKKMHGQYVREKEGIDWDTMWQFIAKGDLKGCTEALICSTPGTSVENCIKLYEISH